MIQSVSTEAAGVLGRRTARNVSQEQSFTGHLLPSHLAGGIDTCLPFEDSKHCWSLRPDVSRYMSGSLAHLPAWASAGTPAWREAVRTHHPGSSQSLNTRFGFPGNGGLSVFLASHPLCLLPFYPSFGYLPTSREARAAS